MTARLLPSHRAVSRLEAAAYDVIDDVLDVLQQVEGRERLAPRTVVIWRRPWQDTQRKRKMHGVDVSPEQRARWQALDNLAATVLHKRERQP